MTSEEKALDFLERYFEYEAEKEDYIALEQLLDVHAAEQRQRCADECDKLKWAHRSVRMAMTHACINAVGESE